MAVKTFKNDKELLADTAVVQAIGKAVARATAAETKRCIAAVKAVELPEQIAKDGKKALALAVASVKAA